MCDFLSLFKSAMTLVVPENLRGRSVWAPCACVSTWSCRHTAHACRSTLTYVLMVFMCNKMACGSAVNGRIRKNWINQTHHFTLLPAPKVPRSQEMGVKYDSAGFDLQHPRLPNTPTLSFRAALIRKATCLFFFVSTPSLPLFNLSPL